MSKVIVKKWINGDFKKIKEFPIEIVKQIQNTSNGLLFVFNDSTYVCSGECAVEFK